MDEVVFYVTQGDPADKNGQESLGAVASTQKSAHYASFRNAEAPRHGAALSGFGAGERLFVAGKKHAAITTYAWGKESADQRMPVPEQMACLALAPQPHVGSHTKSAYRVPWLLAAGSVSGKLYVWELALGALVVVKDAHYQQLSVARFSPCGTFLVTGGLDTRVNVWKTADLLADVTAKPYATFTDHSLGISDVVLSAAASRTDLKVFSASADGRLCVYDVTTKTLATTFVFSHPIECIARDPAGRAVYAALDDGSIRQVPLYTVNAYTHVLEAVGGNGKIVTVDADSELAHTFVHHRPDAGSGAVATSLAVSMDGMRLVSGDSAGHVYVTDVVTKQIIKTFTPCKSGIACVQLAVCSSETLRLEDSFDKKHRLLPQLKRVLVSPDESEHTVTMQIPGGADERVDFELWLQTKAAEELEFKLHQTQDVGDTAELESKLAKVSAAYTSLKANYEELLRAHSA